MRRPPFTEILAEAPSELTLVPTREKVKGKEL